MCVLCSSSWVVGRRTGFVEFSRFLWMYGSLFLTGYWLFVLREKMGMVELWVAPHLKVRGRENRMRLWVWKGVCVNVLYVIIWILDILASVSPLNMPESRVDYCTGGMLHRLVLGCVLGTDAELYRVSSSSLTDEWRRRGAIDEWN